MAQYMNKSLKFVTKFHFYIQIATCFNWTYTKIFLSDIFNLSFEKTFLHTLKNVLYIIQQLTMKSISSISMSCHVMSCQFKFVVLCRLLSLFSFMLQLVVYYNIDPLHFLYYGIKWVLLLYYTKRTTLPLHKVSVSVVTKKKSVFKLKDGFFFNHNKSIYALVQNKCRL